MAGSGQGRQAVAGDRRGWVTVIAQRLLSLSAVREEGTPWPGPGAPSLLLSRSYRLERGAGRFSWRDARATADAPMARATPAAISPMARVDKPSLSPDMLTIAVRRAGVVAAAVACSVKAGTGVAAGAGAGEAGAGAAAGAGAGAGAAGAAALVVGVGDAAVRRVVVAAGAAVVAVAGCEAG